MLLFLVFHFFCSPKRNETKKRALFRMNFQTLAETDCETSPQMTVPFVCANRSFHNLFAEKESFL